MNKGDCNLRFKCLVLDHDDTVVNSTPQVNYPSFLQSLHVLRPGLEMPYEQFISYCFDPGFSKLLSDILGYSEKEMDYQYESWKEYIRTHIPSFFEGMASLLSRFHDHGGKLVVASHSCNENILRDYSKFSSVLPDLVFGWELGEGKRKPSGFPIEETMKVFSLKAEELLVVDDLKPGLDMARACNVPFAWAGWGTNFPKIRQFMKENSDFFLQSVNELEQLLYLTT